MVEARGLPLVKDIFHHSHYRDEQLAATIERFTGLAVEDLVADVGTWWHRRASSLTSKAKPWAALNGGSARDAICAAGRL